MLNPKSANKFYLTQKHNILRLLLANISHFVSKFCLSSETPRIYGASLQFIHLAFHKLRQLFNIACAEIKFDAGSFVNLFNGFGIAQF